MLFHFLCVCTCVYFCVRVVISTASLLSRTAFFFFKRGFPAYTLSIHLFTAWFQNCFHCWRVYATTFFRENFKIFSSHSAWQVSTSCSYDCPPTPAPVFACNWINCGERSKLLSGWVIHYFVHIWIKHTLRDLCQDYHSIFLLSDSWWDKCVH